LNKNIGKKVQLCLSYAVFFLSGAGIFLPLKSSDNTAVSLLTSLIISVCVLFLLLKLTNKYKGLPDCSSITGRIFTLIIVLICVFSLLLLLTEVVKDTSFITNRGISLMYYTAISVSILLVNLYISSGTERGIFRFSVLSTLPFLMLFFVLFAPFFTVKSAVFDFGAERQGIYNGILPGIKSGLFLSADSVFYLLLFDDLYEDTENKNRCFLSGLVISYAFILALVIIPRLIFGKELASSLDMPDYSLARLVYGFDITELVSGLRIVSFLIKGSVYMRLCGRLIVSTQKKLRFKIKNVILTLHLLLPVSFLSLAIYDTNLDYGSLQHLIYPSAVISPLLLLLYIILMKKKT